MNCIIERSSRSPAYLRLYNRLKEDIVKGVYAYGSKLPSKRIMAEEAGLSTITVEHSYALLCDEGYIESRERSGYFVIFRVSDGFASSSAMPAAPALVRPPQGTGPDFPFSVLTKAMRGVMSSRGEAIFARSPNSGSEELREALRQYLARNRGIYVDISQIIIGSGAEYLYSLIVDVLGRERVFALESPSYEKIEKVYRAAGVDCELLPLGGDGIESSALAGTRAEVLHVSPYRSFPTGITAPASKRHEYVRWAEKGGRYIVEDDFESEFTVSSKPEETLFAIAGGERVIYLNTFSQTISPSLRVGYMVLPKSLVPRFEERAGFYSCTVPTFDQLVLAELISGGDFERHINRVRRAKRRAAGERG